ncbi:hypothetical protein ABOM_001045 [Aspergillus bombycis]|uniref:Agmatine deiminase n=1 Tax=Aspergillus bombycis TaxID=109264 RepID=A0A1F8AFX4_9EURO|nr:hypothetical protein ABOM_001045 [Aspergillus bombycis]OGM50245.1 hypothetical protein ABOM_001045 [Aspergillus bombycis]
MAADSEFFMPDEGLTHERTIMAWPGNNNPNYQEADSLERMKAELSAIAKAVSDFEPVTLLVSCEQVSDARRRLDGRGKYDIDIKAIGANDLEPWMRDVAPTFVFGQETNSTLYGADFNFNGWGERYPSASNAHLAGYFLSDTRIPRVETSIVIEGGSLEIDGEGTLLATESSVLNPNRNPGMTREAAEEELHRVLGVDKVIWVPGVKNEDVTDAHIDALARFTAPGKVVLSRPSPDDQVWTAVYHDTKRILSKAVDAKGRAFEITELPEADANDIDSSETEMVLGYVNYLLVNGGVIAPRFGSRKTDTKAKEILQSLFPEREIVQVYLNEIAINGGGIHCMTQQIPAAKP